MSNDVLAAAPQGQRARELWLQHTAGYILMRDVRDYAISQIDRSLGDDAKEAALNAIDNAVYGLMMVLDGVSGQLRNSRDIVTVRGEVRLSRDSGNSNSGLVQAIPFEAGDGMCMGYHMWKVGDFGLDPVVEVASGNNT